LQLAITQATQSDWYQYGPMGSGVIQLRAAIARLLWCAFQPQFGIVGLPQGWFRGRQPEVCTILHADPELTKLGRVHLESFFGGNSEFLVQWILSCTASWVQPFDLAVRDADLETLNRFSQRAQSVRTNEDS